MTKPVTIRDVAREAGVSPATVSNVLNGRQGRVSAQTARNVLAVVEALGYRPKTFVGIPGGQRTETLGLIVASLVAPVFAYAVSGAQAVAARLDYNVILCNNFNKEASEAEAARVLVDRNVDGIVFISSSSYHRRDALDIVKEAGLPFVVVNRLLDPEAGLHILVANEQGTYQATQHLIELGHRRIGCIHLPVDGPKATTAAVQRLQGFRRALADYGLDESHWVRPGVLGEENATAVGYTMMQEMLMDEPSPTAVICGSDYLAVGAMRAVSDSGARVPEDIAVIGHDDTPAADYVTPPLSSVRQPMEAAGARAVEALVHHLWRGTPLRGVEWLPCELVVRSSSTRYVHV